MDATKEWPAILKFGNGATITEELVSQHYRDQAKKYHPDAGGIDADMQQLNLAKQLALKWIAGERQRQEEIKRAEQVALQHFRAAQNAISSVYQQQAAASQNFASQLGNLGWMPGYEQQRNSYVTQTAPIPPVEETPANIGQTNNGFWTRMRGIFSGHR